MKTPREILFERHRRAEARLDEVRRRVLAGLPATGNVEAREPGRTGAHLLASALRNIWLELIWPSRRAWAGLAALCLAVLAANLEMKAAFPVARAAGRAPADEVVQAFVEQRRVLAELLPPMKSPRLQAAPPKDDRRSERWPLFKNA